VNSTKVKKRKHRFLRRTLRVLFVIFLFFFLIVLFIRSSFGQNLIIDRATAYVSSKTNTKIAVDKAFITYNGNLRLEGVFLEDKKGDTLVYSNYLEADIPLLGTIRGTKFGVERLEWNGLKATIVREDTIAGYNFQFLIDAFVTDTLSNSSEKKNIEAANPKIVLKNIFLKNIDITYKDIPLGIISENNIDELQVDMKKVDLEKMIFKATNLELTNSSIDYNQSYPQITTTTTTEVILPKLTAEKINIANTNLVYTDEQLQFFLDSYIYDFSITQPKINLEESIYDIRKVVVRKSDIAIKIKEDTTKNVVKETDDKNFEWPNISLNIAEIDLDQNKFSYVANNKIIEEQIFDPNAIALHNFNLNAKDIAYKDQSSSINLVDLNFKESSGFELMQLHFLGSATNKNIAIRNFNFRTPKSNTSGVFDLEYKSLSQFIRNPEESKFNLELPQFQLSVKDFLSLQPTLKKNTYINTLSNKTLHGILFLNGGFNTINLSKLNLAWGKNTKIVAQGYLKNTTNIKNLTIHLPTFKAETTREDIAQLLDEKNLGVQLPKTIKLYGEADGTLENISANLHVNSSQGNIKLVGTLTNKEVTNLKTKISIVDYNVGQLLQNEAFGELSLSLKADAKGSSINNLTAAIDTEVSKFNYNKYPIKDLILNANFNKGQGEILSNYKDKNLNLKLKGDVKLDSINTTANLDVDLVGANLQGLQIMKRNIKTGMNVSLNYNGNLNRYKIGADVNDGVVVYDNRTYLIGNIKAKAYVDKDTTSVFLKNRALNVTLESNTDPETFSIALQDHLKSYFVTKDTPTESTKKPVKLNFEAKIVQTPLFSDVFLVNLKDIDTVSVLANFDEKYRKLDAKIIAPHINYGGNEIDSLNLLMNTNQKDFNFKLGFNGISANPINIPKTSVTGYQNGSELLLNFSGYHKEETLMNVDAKLLVDKNRSVFSVNPNNLILNKHVWSIPEENEVILENLNTLLFKDFKITKGNQSIKITDKLDSIQKNHVALVYKNFKITEVFNYLNPDKEIAKGILNGNFVLEQPFKNTGIVANLDVSQLALLNTNFGELTIDAKSLGSSKYDFNANLSGGEVGANLTGDYFVANDDANLNLDLKISDFKMKALNTLSLGEVKEAEGSFSGDFKLRGKISKPVYNGELNFKNAALKVTKLNTKFTLLSEQLKVDNNGLTMSNFTVLDAKQNKLILSGAIKTKSFINPSFNLNLKAKNFRVLNAKKEDNESLYGIATFDADAKLKGDLQIPKLTADISMGAGTNVTYVLPSSYANIEDRDGVVVFVNRKKPDAILTQTEEQVAIVNGFDINTKLKVNKEASVTVVIDKDTGDNFKVAGDGEFLFNMKPNGKIGLTGTFEVAKGHYELNLYGVVNRKFSLAPGGKVTWSGDPFNASINASAIYNLETAAAPLMASQISNEDPSVKNRFKQVLPFNVYLNIDGELLQPEISFNLQMPEDSRGAIGGQVYGRVQQVNQQEEELNKQVFSLLVLNRFYPNSGSDGSAGGFATIARDNLNDAVSGQLNAFSNKVLGNSSIELDFDLNSYTDFQGTTETDRTQLGVTAQKKLFDDKLTVRVGSDVDLQGSNSSSQTSPLIGNVSLEYKLTEDGRYRLRGFRRSEFENVIDGQTIVSGIAVVFTQEFNEFKEMWNAIFRSQTKENNNKEEKEEKENNGKETKQQDK